MWLLLMNGGQCQDLTSFDEWACACVGPSELSLGEQRDPLTNPPN